MSISGNGQYYIDSSQIVVDQGNVTITGDNGGFNQTIGQNYYNGSTDPLTPIRVGLFGFEPATLTLVGGGDGVNITIEDQSVEGFSATIKVGVGESEDPTSTQGTLSITQGATVVSRNNAIYSPEDMFARGGSYSVNVGVRGEGTINVVGEGSFLGAYGLEPRITIGRDDGLGTVNVNAGGDIGTTGLILGRGEGGDGTLNIDGAGSTVTVSNDYGLNSSFNGQDFSGYGPSTTIGRQGGSGFLQISNGGEMTIKNVDGLTDSVQLDIGQDYDSTGMVTVKGDGSTLTISQIGPVDEGASGNAGLKVGRGGQGILDIYDNGVVNVLGDDAFVSVGRIRDGQATERSNQINVSEGGILNIDSGQFKYGGMNIAHELGTNGIVTVEGQGSQVNINSDGDGTSSGAFLQVGRRGDGQLFVHSGAEVTIDGGGDSFPILFIGVGDGDGSAPANGYASINGAGSTITVHSDNVEQGGFVAVGRNPNSYGMLKIEDGGVLQLTGSAAGIEIAGAPPNTNGNSENGGVVVVSGEGALLDAASKVAVGADLDSTPIGFDVSTGGNGRLDIIAGGEVAATQLIIGDRGVLSVQDGQVTGDLLLTGLFHVGGDGTIASANFVGDASLLSGEFRIEIEDFSNSLADTILIDGDADVNLGASTFDLSGLERSEVRVGDEIVFASVMGELSAEFFDQITVIGAGFEIELTAGQREADDGNGGVEQQLFVSVASVEETLAPIAQDDVFRTSESEVVAGALLANDTGTDDPNIMLATVNGSAGNIGDTVALTSGASVVVQADGAFTYDPNGAFDSLLDGQTGTDSFVYTIEDNFGATDQATATFTIDGEGVVEPTPDPTPDPDPVGTAGADEFAGDGGADVFDGGAGNDIISGGGGRDTLAGGRGKDEISGGGGKDLLQGNGGKDLLQGNGGKDTLEGGGGKDTLEGGGGRDLLKGDGGRDLLDGGGGKDTMEGGGGRDEILGGRGSDILTGGGGGDRFVFDRGNGRDTVTDFQQGRDKIVIEGGVAEFAELVITQFGDDVRIRIANTLVTIEDDQVGNFTTTDFVF